MTKKQIALVSILWALPVLVGNLGGHFFAGSAYAAEDHKRETRKVPAMRERTYKELSEAQALIDPKSVPVEKGEKPPDVKPDPKAAIEKLKRMLDRRGMNSYEIAQVWNTMAFAYYTLNDMPNTIKSYENVLKQTITEALELSSLRALFQLYYAQEDYKKSLEYITRWQKLKETPDADVTYIKATVYYQLGNIKEALKQAKLVEQIAIDQKRTIKESWWYLQVVCYNELKDYDNVIRVLKELIAHYPKKQYWMSLAGMYSEENKDDKSLSAYYAAYMQGMFDKNMEVVMLAQRLLNADVPYEATQVLEKGMKDGIVDKDEKNLKLLATAYTMADETSKAIDAWQRAAKAAKDDGEVFYRLAQALTQQDRNKEAVDAYKKALDHPKDLRDVSEVWFWLGSSLIQLKDWDQATHAFEQAAKEKAHAKSANQYIKYVENEKKREEELKKMLESGKAAPKPEGG